MKDLVACAALSLGLAMTAMAQDAVPGAPAAAATQLPQRQFILFFDHGEVGTPQDADPLLPQIAEIFRRNGYAKVAIECHSDKGKTHEAELKLTQERADRVKATLVLDGVTATAISATGVGYADPLPGAPPAMAVSNRRCEITLS